MFKLANIKDDLSTLINDQTTCDLIFYVGKEKKIVYGHKLLFCLQNDSWYQQLYFTDLKKNRHQKLIKHLPNIEPELFQNVIEFCYTKETKLELGTVWDLILFSMKENFLNLANYCCLFILNNLDQKDPFQILQKTIDDSKLLEDLFVDKLQKGVLRFIAKHSAKYFKTKNYFLHLSFPIIKLILMNQKLTIKEYLLLEHLIEKYHQKNDGVQIQNFNKNELFPFIYPHLISQHSLEKMSTEFKKKYEGQPNFWDPFDNYLKAHKNFCKRFPKSKNKNYSRYQFFKKNPNLSKISNTNVKLIKKKMSLINHNNNNNNLNKLGSTPSYSEKESDSVLSDKKNYISTYREKEKEKEKEKEREREKENTEMKGKRRKGKGKKKEKKEKRKRKMKGKKKLSRNNDDDLINNLIEIEKIPIQSRNLYQTEFIQTLLLVSDSKRKRVEQIVTTLEKSNAFLNIKVKYINQKLPKWKSMQKANAIFLYTFDRKPKNSKKLGNMLASYVEDGGGLVICAYKALSILMYNSHKDANLGGRIVNDFLPTTRGEIIHGKRNSIGKVLLPNHEIMKGVGIFDGGRYSCRMECQIIQTADNSKTLKFENSQNVSQVEKNSVTNNINKENLLFNFDNLENTDNLSSDILNYYENTSQRITEQEQSDFFIEKMGGNQNENENISNQDQGLIEIINNNNANERVENGNGNGNGKEGGIGKGAKENGVNSVDDNGGGDDEEEGVKGQGGEEEQPKDEGEEKIEGGIKLCEKNDSLELLMEEKEEQNIENVLNKNESENVKKIKKLSSESDLQCDVTRVIALWGDGNPLVSIRKKSPTNGYVCVLNLLPVFNHGYILKSNDAPLIITNSIQFVANN
ncbi:btb/poz domain-containing protein [Anaeramoeba flamelloides]|uniref:Btb/poz domain-containing protein n=1 Tax=Anaeramoeba flamelloides TaxID=1746091 RepID=A0ABQ8XJ50_9EUKA|nr:btb/poz domain-containing protein [Anaeramoeba flamelloides]